MAYTSSSSNDSSGPNSTPDGNFYSYRGVGEVREDLQLSKVMRIKRAPKWKSTSSLITTLFGRSGFSVNIQWKLTTNLQVYHFVTQNMHRLQFVCEKIQVTMREQSCTAVWRAYAYACWRANRLGLRLIPTLGNIVERGIWGRQTRWLCAHDRAFALIQFTAKLTLILWILFEYTVPLHTHIPQLRSAPCWLTWKVTASWNTCKRWYPSGEARSWNFKMLQYFCWTCIMQIQTFFNFIRVSLKNLAWLKKTKTHVNSAQKMLLGFTYFSSCGKKFIIQCNLFCF